jgi:hypothetical protein
MKYDKQELMPLGEYLGQPEQAPTIYSKRLLYPAPSTLKPGFSLHGDKLCFNPALSDHPPKMDRDPRYTVKRLEKMMGEFVVVIAGPHTWASLE